MDFRTLIRLVENANFVRVYRGIPSNRQDGFETKYGLFFADRRDIAAGYAGKDGKVIEADLDVSHALQWTNATSANFQEYVISWRREYRSPPGTRAALTRHNRNYGTNTSLAAAVGEVLKFAPEQLEWQELDPVMGFVRAYARELDCDVIIRDHDKGNITGGGKEFIVFSSRRIKPVKLGSEVALVHSHS